MKGVTGLFSALPLALALALPLALALAPPAAAEDAPYLAVRPFLMLDEQKASAVNTFNAVLGQSNQMFWGGGLSITQEDRFYVDLAASQYKKTGQRAFRSANGDVFRLGIPARTTIVPFELTGGYRFHHWRHFLPYAGGGVGIFHYTEKSDFPNAGDDVDARHVGAILEGGVEVRIHRWVGAGIDVHYTHVPGILGAGGISKDANENDLGGVSGRFRVIIGR